jgi:lipopolysaccharide heptosyltransferase III
MSILKPNKIVISRTDSIGDVILTLPLAGILKSKFPEAEIIFLGNTYTKPIIEKCKHVDQVWEWALIQKWSYPEQINWLKKQEIDAFIHVFPRKEIARIVKKAEIENRIGTSHRAFHLMTCNIKPNFTRKRSNLHEAQLNTKLLSSFGIDKEYSLIELSAMVGFSAKTDSENEFLSLIDTNLKTIILHPKSQGSAIEWGVQNFMKLAASLDASKYQIFITGTEKEASYFRETIPNQDNIIDLSGKMSLDQLISFIGACDVLVAASTGPLHIAGISGTHAIGLFIDKRPIHPGRWKPLGNHVTILTAKNNSTTTQPLQIDLRDVLRAVNES